jgi:WD40 repeat protein
MKQWARLAVNKVNQCHTHADVDLALREIPAGMEAIYDRMASSIVNNPNPRGKLWATRILECVTCSLRVLKVVELSHAIGGDISEILDLHRTIRDLCGGFVNVDDGGNVAMIHQTARDYLLDNSDEGRPFTISRQAAHKQLFLSSMRCVMQTGLRAKLNRNQKPEFLEYAARSWSSHLTSASLYDHETMTTLKKFLTGNWVLTWIHTAAADGQLRVLIRASKDLSRFSLNGKGQGLGMSTEGTLVVELDLFESWAVDLLQVVGKFNSLLRRKPDSIYKSIPPLCPKASSIYQLFGKAEAKNLSVTGLSAETWDDSLARIPLGHGHSTAFASAITAAGSQIAVLTSSGSVFLYDSSDFMEGKSSPIKHGERVNRMHLNSTATLLATYGYRTTKVWEVSTGKCMVSVESVKINTRPLDMLFLDNNSTLLVGSDDRTVRSLNWSEAHPAWEVVAELDEQELEEHFGFMNLASHMALSRDGSMVAVASRNYPLSAWEIGGLVHIGHCWKKNEADAIRELHDLVWHPHLPQILALNLEGIVFKWNPYESEINELSVSATKLSISSNGDLFATGDHNGLVKLYQTSTFSLLYQLAGHDAVFGMTFSPDSRRLYDIRGYYASVWEPNALMRLTEQSGSEIHSFTPSSEASVIVSSAVDFVTALAGSPKGRLYCYGTEGGVVSLHDIQYGKLGDVYISTAKLAIEKIVWSAEGKYICFADVSRRVTIISVTQGAGEVGQVVQQKAIRPVRKFSGPIFQLLFQPDSSYLLVHTPSQMCIISLTSPLVERSRDLEDIRIQWIIHPADPSLIVGFGPSNTYVFGWDLVQRRKYGISFTRPPDISSSGSSTESHSAYQIDRVLVTHDKRHLFLQMSHPRAHSLSKSFFFFETHAISTSTSILESQETPAQANENSPPSIVLHSVPAELSSNIASALSFLSHNRLVFLSKSFAICSIQIPWTSHDKMIPLHPAIQRTNTMSSTAMAAGEGGVEEELFALPGDWISRDCLRLCCAWGVERSLLCPTSGEVAVVRFDEAYSNEILSQEEPLIQMEQDNSKPSPHPQQDSGYGGSLRDNTVSGGLSFVSLGPSGKSEFTDGNVSREHQSEAKDSNEQDPNRDFQEPDYDIRSVISDHDSLNSQVSNNRSNYRVLAERHLSTLLAYNEELRPLYEEALKIIQQERFRNNLRRLLKRFYLDLSLQASSNLEKATIHTFRSNRSRVRIAQQIIDHLSPENQEGPTIPPLDMTLQIGDLEAWIQNTPSLALNQLHRPDASMDVTPVTWDDETGDVEANKNEMRPENSSLGPESSDNDDYEAPTALPSIAEMESFLFQGSSFRSFTLNLRLFLIPASLVSLTRILTSIPRDRMWFSDNDDLSIINKLKAKFEDVTEADWDWWPLEPRRKNLKKNQVRVNWECVSYPSCSHIMTDKEYGSIAENNSGLKYQSRMLTHTSCFCRQNPLLCLITISVRLG